MNLKEPPSSASWILLHLTPGRRNDALGGDLLEEFRSGRSVSWYWRQVIAAIAIACLRELVDHRFLLLFAALWSVLAPAWDLLIENIEQNPTVFGPIWNLAWPWSTCAALGLFLAIGSTFIWTGTILFLVLRSAITRSFGVRRIGRALVMSLCAFIAVSAVMFALPMLLPGSGHLIDRLGFASSITPSAPHPEINPDIYYVYRYLQQIDKQTGEPVVLPTLVRMDANDFYRDSTPAPAVATPVSEIEDTSARVIVARTPYFLSLLCGLWGISLRLNNRHKTIAT